MDIAIFDEIGKKTFWKFLILQLENTIGYSLDNENVGCILDVAVTYNFDRLKRACFSYAFHNFQIVKKTETWKSISIEAKEYFSTTAESWGALSSGK